ncbi:MAG: hypothetical protein QMD76_03135 [Anaerosomatales bacterium]|nr:hypothetical protein [Anaerosomatales bacterium]
MSRPKVTFPHMGPYWIGFKALAQELGCDVVVPPPMSARTLELGALYSPDFVCVPFKYNLGNFIEAAELGADTVIQAIGGCRFGYYAEVQQAIMEDLGYDVRFVRIDAGRNVFDFLRDLRAKLVPHASFRQMKRAFSFAFRKGEAIDAMLLWVLANLGFEREPGAIERIEDRFLRALDEASTVREVDALLADTLEELRSVPLDKPGNPVRIGIVGELYVVMEPFSNLNLERQVARRGVEVHREMTLTTLIKHAIEGDRHIDSLVRRSDGWVRHHLGSHGTESVTLAHEYARAGFDGVIHLKPFGCMPEVNAMAVLQRYARERELPVLFVSCDTQTAETGVATRVEAFCDMLAMRRRGVVHA